MDINNWSAVEAARAENTWGHKLPQYTIDAFKFITEDTKSWLDLGCGFGRFLTWLDLAVTDPDYIGIDSSQAMIDRLLANHPTYETRVFAKDITLPLVHYQQAVICSAVMIHIPVTHQNKVLQNVKAISPYKFVFDINCEDLNGKDNVERFIKLTEHKFRMTWQDEDNMHGRLVKVFPNYDIEVAVYDLRAGKRKVVFFLTKQGTILGG